MTARTFYLVRHGAADPLGQLTEAGAEQSRLIGDRLAHLPIDALWHSPLPRAAASARILADRLPEVFVDEADELTDHVPFVPSTSDISPQWRGFFDGYDRAEAAAGRRTAEVLTARFGRANGPDQRSTHEVLITHAYPIAWLVRAALAAPDAQWMALAGLANASLTVLEYHPGEPPALVMFNDLSHLTPDLRWTGFRGSRP